MALFSGLSTFSATSRALCSRLQVRTWGISERIYRLGCRFMILMYSITYYSEADDIEPLNPIHNALECIDRTTDKKRYSRAVREN